MPEDKYEEERHNLFQAQLIQLKSQVHNHILYTNCYLPQLALYTVCLCCSVENAPITTTTQCGTETLRIQHILPSKAI